MTVYLSPLAEKKLEILLEYLENKWSTKVKNDFLSKFIESTIQISNNPKSCIESIEFTGLFKCIVTKQTSYFYRVLKNEIEIITVFDNRQNSKKIKEEIKKHFG